MCKGNRKREGSETDRQTCKQTKQKRSTNIKNEMKGTEIGEKLINFVSNFGTPLVSPYHT